MERSIKVMLLIVFVFVSMYKFNFNISWKLKRIYKDKFFLFVFVNGEIKKFYIFEFF